MSHMHLTIEERASISHLHKQGVSIRQIASAIGRNESTIKRELDRNFTPSKYSDQDFFRNHHIKDTEKRISTAHNIIQFSLEVIVVVI